MTQLSLTEATQFMNELFAIWTETDHASGCCSRAWLGRRRSAEAPPSHRRRDCWFMKREVS